MDSQKSLKTSNIRPRPYILECAILKDYIQGFIINFMNKAKGAHMLHFFGLMESDQHLPWS